MSAAEEAAASDDEEDDEASRAAEQLMQSVHRGFTAAKSKGVPCAARLMKEITRVCQSSSYEIKLLQDSLQQWEISLFDWAFDESSPLHKDLQQLSEEADDLADDEEEVPPCTTCILTKLPPTSGPRQSTLQLAPPPFSKKFTVIACAPAANSIEPSLHSVPCSPSLFTTRRLPTKRLLPSSLQVLKV